MMQASHFERIQICCDDLASSVLDYATLLDQEPRWIGDYRLLDLDGGLYDQGSSAWFLLENTYIELFSSARTNLSTGIVGLVMGHHQQQEKTLCSDEFTLRSCWYTDSYGESFVEKQLNLTQRDREGFSVTMLEQASAIPVLENLQDIKTVDHLVLSSHDAQACIARFGEAGLGLRLALDKNVPEWGGRMLFFRCAKLTLEVIVPANKQDKPDSFWGIAYRTDDINLSSNRFERNQIEFSDVRSGRKPNTLVSTIKSHSLGVPTLLIQALL